MAEIIHLHDVQAARERARRRAAGSRSLERAAAILRENLAAAAIRLRDATPAEQPELLERVEKLAAMVRYAIRMIDSDSGDGSAELGGTR
jgi:hypothetical protein